MNPIKFQHKHKGVHTDYSSVMKEITQKDNQNKQSYAY